VEDRISELEHKMEIKEKTEKILIKQLKSCERNMQELSDSIKRPKLRIISTEEGDYVHAKVIHKIFNKIIQKIDQISRKFCPFRYRKPPEQQADLTQTQHPHSIIIKTISTENIERILKAVRKNKTNNI
jgi:hypothetical protein